MYQYVFTNGGNDCPFTLFIRMPREQLPLSSGSDLVSSYPVKDALVIVEYVYSDEEIDSFLDLLDEVVICMYSHM